MKQRFPQCFDLSHWPKPAPRIPYYAIGIVCLTGPLLGSLPALAADEAAPGENATTPTATTPVPLPTPTPNVTKVDKEVARLEGVPGIYGEAVISVGNGNAIVAAAKAMAPFSQNDTANIREAKISHLKVLARLFQQNKGLGAELTKAKTELDTVETGLKFDPKLKLNATEEEQIKTRIKADVAALKTQIDALIQADPQQASLASAVKKFCDITTPWAQAISTSLLATNLTALPSPADDAKPGANPTAKATTTTKAIAALAKAPKPKAPVTVKPKLAPTSTRALMGATALICAASTAATQEEGAPTAGGKAESGGSTTAKPPSEKAAEIAVMADNLSELSTLWRQHEILKAIYGQAQQADFFVALPNTTYIAGLTQLLGQLGGSASVGGSLTAAIAKANTQIGRYSTDLIDYLNTTMQAVQKISTSPATLDSDPLAFRGAQQLLEALDDLDNKARPLLAQIKGSPYAKGIATSLANQRVQRLLFKDAISIVDESMAGDMSEFETHQARLFYFTNAVQLIQVLNPRARLFNPESMADQESADQQRRALREADLGLHEALGKASDLSSQLQQLQHDISLAQTAKMRTGRALIAATRSVVDAKNVVDGLNKKPGGDPAQNDLAEAALLNAQRNEEDAQESDDNARARVTELQGKFESTNAALGDAQRRLSEGQSAVRNLRLSAQLVAQDDVEALARARNNPAIWYAPANSASQDPARRVQLYAYPDSSVVYVRGAFKDVYQVLNIISEYDRPAPQALMTLWTLQINGKQSKNLNEATALISSGTRELSRNLIEVQKALQLCINAEVNRVATLYRSRPGDTPVVNERMARYFFYAPEVRRQLGFPLSGKEYVNMLNSGVAPSKSLANVVHDAEYVTRWTLPDPASVTTFGQSLFVLSLASRSSRENIVEAYRKTLLDNLTDMENRTHSQDLKEALAPYKRRLEQYNIDYKAYKAELKKYKADGKGAQPKAPEPALREPFFPFMVLDAPLESIYGPRPPAPSPWPYSTDALSNPQHEQLSANQKEILMAIQTRVRESVVNQVRFLLERSARANQPDFVRQQLRAQYLPLIGWLAWSSNALPPDVQDSATQWGWGHTGAAATLPEEWTSYWLPGETPATFFKNVAQQVEMMQKASPPTLISTPQVMDLMDMSASQLVEAQIQNSSLTRAIPRVAAADKMIKDMVRVAQLNLDEYLVQPTLTDLRRQVSGKGVTLGTIQRTSVLATNRAMSRVSPSANASLQFAPEVDYLQQANQLSGMVSQYKGRKKENAVNGGVLGTGVALLANGVKTGDAFGIGALLSILAGNASGPPPVPAETYSVNTGNEWKITPIFDPSGQAMRFKFDYNAAVRVREPDGSVNPEVPRVEHHIVNTEVGLDNFEFGEVSRFESNSKLGLPERKSGGVPLVNQLPLLKDIPLIGYFARQKKQAAESQQSLIYAQTVVYPTVADIVELMVEQSARPTSSFYDPSTVVIPALPTNRTDDSGWNIALPPVNPARNAALNEERAQTQPARPASTNRPVQSTLPPN